MSKKFTVIGTRRHGFFTNLFHTLQHLHEAEMKCRIPIVYWYGGMYKARGDKYNGIKSRNVWDYYFKPVSKYSAEKLFPKMIVKRYGKLDIRNKNVEVVRRYRHDRIRGEPEGCWDARKRPPEKCLYNTTKEDRLFVNGLIRKYIKLQPVVAKKIEDFFTSNMNGVNLAGIHMRGSADYVAEQGHNPLEQYIKHITRHIEKNPDDKIFAATDRKLWLDVLKERFADKVICYNSFRGSEDGLFSLPLKKIQSRLRKNQVIAGAKTGEDVLIDAILLSKCSVIFHGLSNVAAAATFFNPDIKAVYICK